MYAVIAIEPYKRQALRNEFGCHGDLAFLYTIYGRWGYDFEIWELEFDTYSPLLLAATLRGLDSWGTNQSILAELLETDCIELWEGVTAPIPDRPSLSWCVRRYLTYYPNAWLDYWSSAGKCGVVSHDFLSFLRRYNAVSHEQITGGVARVVRQYLSDTKYASAEFPAEAHEVVAVGRIRIDFTRRQYDRAAAVPTAWVSYSSHDNVFPSR